MSIPTFAQSSLVNETCACTSLDRAMLGRTLAALPEAAAFDQLAQTHPNLFADAPVYVSQSEMTEMRGTILAIESVVHRGEFAELIRSQSPGQVDRGPAGVLMGYDFHLSADGPKLIEINTNAGGLFLNAIACDAQRACCPDLALSGELACPPDLAERVVAMFEAEFILQRGSGRPELIAIVDDVPQEQYLYPEFLLVRSLLEAHGLPAVIADPRDFTHRDGKLWLGARAVSLVYNRLVDFDLSAPDHAALASAYASGDVVVTPNPHHHAVFADKRNLVALSNPTVWVRSPLTEAETDGLARIPSTRLVTPALADALWADRNDLFFKPISGHGGKGVYRGDKITKKVWAAIVQGGYVAQQRVSPSERVVRCNGVLARHKLDIRLYTYAGEMLLAVARLYQGQATNFRTPGGGFAPVIVLSGAQTCAANASSPIE